MLENITRYSLYVDCHNTATLKCAHIMLNTIRHRHGITLFNVLLKFNDFCKLADRIQPLYFTYILIQLEFRIFEVTSK
uniref:Uncharacterized protein n=1 Tax=Staphylococcus aureus TaxID=1280 RepID=Q93I84_STAAU|nr:hypothetical protein [Staphylococcus aureus]BAC53840.1 hypothetical protein [Staphylococcus aureus]